MLAIKEPRVQDRGEAHPKQHHGNVADSDTRNAEFAPKNLRNEGQHDHWAYHRKENWNDIASQRHSRSHQHFSDRKFAIAQQSALTLPVH